MVRVRLLEIIYHPLISRWVVATHFLLTSFGILQIVIFFFFFTRFKIIINKCNDDNVKSSLFLVWIFGRFCCAPQPLVPGIFVIFVNVRCVRRACFVQARWLLDFATVPRGVFWSNLATLPPPPPLIGVRANTCCERFYDDDNATTVATGSSPPVRGLAHARSLSRAKNQQVECPSSR